MTRFQFVADHSDTTSSPRRGWTVKRLCALLDVRRSSFYTSRAYANLCDRLDVQQSMGAVGSSADNALAESFNATLKREVELDP
ncbi:Integrase core domain-containing protein [Pseudonocardia ammonioxydans]|uniref:Integrase core domain-containing protein n=1 Tax=Pseudonocardia ammonioxydans TaxID=260086 RepID=A0A1I5IJP7_PSUAM|nr:Integrase core domain-containing protein [Pseudonocardia ammonioxydans]